MIANNVNVGAALGIEFKPQEEPQEIVVYAQNTSPDKVEDDYEFARTNLRTLITDGMKSVKEVSDLAAQAQDSRAFEVAGNFLNGVVDAHNKLLHLSKQVKDIKKDSGAKPSTGAQGEVTNNILVGSSAQLLKMIRSEK